MESDRISCREQGVKWLDPADVGRRDFEVAPLCPHWLKRKSLERAHHSGNLLCGRGF